MAVGDSRGLDVDVRGTVTCLDGDFVLSMQGLVQLGQTDGVVLFADAAPDCRAFAATHRVPDSMADAFQSVPLLSGLAEGPVWTYAFHDVDGGRAHIHAEGSNGPGQHVSGLLTAKIREGRIVSLSGELDMTVAEDGVTLTGAMDQSTSYEYGARPTLAELPGTTQ